MEFGRNTIGIQLYIYRRNNCTPIEHLSKKQLYTYRTSIEETIVHLSNINRSTIEHLLNIYRTSIVALLKYYRISFFSQKLLFNSSLAYYFVKNNSCCYRNIQRFDFSRYGNFNHAVCNTY